MAVEPYIYAYTVKGSKRKAMNVSATEIKVMRKLQRKGDIHSLQVAKLPESEQRKWMRAKTFEVPTFMKSLKK